MPPFLRSCHKYVSGFEKRANFAKNAKITRRHQKSRLQSWFIGTPVLLLKKSNVRSCYIPTRNGGVPTWGIKWPILAQVWLSQLPCPNRKWAGCEITASVVPWLKNSYTWFHTCGHYSLKVMCDKKQTFGLSAKWALFSNAFTLLDIQEAKNFLRKTKRI